MSPYGPNTPETQDAEEAAWRHQERLLSALRSGAAGELDDVRYRDVFAALDRESLPALPEDFSMRVAADARRLADARAQVSRFKTMLTRLLSLLYLPAMLAVATLYWPGSPVSMAHPSFGEHALPLWLVAIIGLCLSVFAVEKLKRKTSADASS